ARVGGAHVEQLIVSRRVEASRALAIVAVAKRDELVASQLLDQRCLGNEGAHAPGIGVRARAGVERELLRQGPRYADESGGAVPGTGQLLGEQRRQHQRAAIGVRELARLVVERRPEVEREGAAEQLRAG